MNYSQNAAAPALTQVTDPALLAIANSFSQSTVADQPRQISSLAAQGRRNWKRSNGRRAAAAAKRARARVEAYL